MPLPGRKTASYSWKRPNSAQIPGNYPRKDAARHHKDVDKYTGECHCGAAEEAEAMLGPFAGSDDFVQYCASDCARNVKIGRKPAGFPAGTRP